VARCRDRWPAVAVLVVGLTWGYHATHATTASGFRAEKAQRVVQNTQRAARATHSAPDVILPGPTAAPTPGPLPGGPQIRIGPIAMVDVSAWQAGWYPGTETPVVVAAGAEQSDPSRGLLWVDTATGSTWTGEWVAPGTTGAITITRISGTVVSWTSRSGVSGTFDLATHAWTIDSTPSS